MPGSLTGLSIRIDPILLHIWICFVCPVRHALRATCQGGYSESQRARYPFYDSWWPEGQSISRWKYQLGGVGAICPPFQCIPWIAHTRLAGSPSFRGSSSRNCRLVKAPHSYLNAKARVFNFLLVFWGQSLSLFSGGDSSPLIKELWRTNGWVFSKSMIVYVEIWERCKLYLFCLSFSFYFLFSASRPFILETHLKGLLFIIFLFFPLNSSGINLGYLGGKPDSLPAGLNSFAIMRSCLVQWRYSK